MSEPEELYAEMLSRLSAVQTFLGVGSTAAAAAKIHLEVLPFGVDLDAGYTQTEMIAARPYVLVSGGTKTKMRAGGDYAGSQDVSIRLEQVAPVEFGADITATRAAIAAWKATVYGIESAARSQAREGAETCHAFAASTIEAGWSPAEVYHDEGEYLEAEIVVTVDL